MFDKASCFQSGTENTNALVGKSSFPPLLSGFQLSSSNPYNFSLGNFCNAANKKKSLIPQILSAHHSRDILHNFNSLSNFSQLAPFASPFGNPHRPNANNMLGFPNYPKANFFSGIETGASSCHKPGPEVLAKSPAFNNILRGLGTMTYNGKFSYNTHAVPELNSLNASNLDPSTNDK